jgi:YidC/Oxa1 family membrane protein insertase
MDQRRFLLALVLSFLLLLAYEQLVVRPYRKAQPSPQTQGQAPGQPAPEAERHTSPGARPANPEAPGAAVAGSGLAAPAADAPTVTIETDLVRATVTKLGARLKSLELKEFRETVKPDSPLLDLVTASPVLPLSMELGAGSSDADISYEASSSSIRVSGPEQAEVVFRGSTADGRTIEKRYRFLGNSYLFDVVVSGSAIKGSVGLILTPVSEQAASGGQKSGHEQAVVFANAKLIEKSIESLTTPVEVQD